MELVKIINARHVINSVAEQEVSNTHLTYWMTKFIAKTENEQKFYADEMCKIFNKYAQQNEDATMVEDPGIRFNLSELALGIKLTMKQMYQLLDFVDEDK